MTKTINKPIFKVAIKNNWKVTVITVCVAVAILLMARLVFGFRDFGDAPLEIGYAMSNQVSMYFFLGGNMDMVLIVLLIIVGGGFIHRPALDTSLAAYLTVPVSRKSYAITTMLAYYTLIIAWTVVAALAGLAIIFSFIPVGAEFKFIFIANYFAVVGVFLLVALTISAISYFAATLFAGTKVKGMYVLIPLAFYILAMFASIGTVVKELRFMRYLTPYSWFEQEYIFNNGIDKDMQRLGEFSFAADGAYSWWDRNQWLPALLCLGIIAACSIASVVIYRKKKFAI